MSDVEKMYMLCMHAIYIKIYEILLKQKEIQFLYKTYIKEKIINRVKMEIYITSKNDIHYFFVLKLTLKIYTYYVVLFLFL